jgi:hypothetical protein
MSKDKKRRVGSYNIPHYSLNFFFFFGIYVYFVYISIYLIVWSCICKTAFENASNGSFSTPFISACRVLLD